MRQNAALCGNVLTSVLPVCSHSDLFQEHDLQSKETAVNTDDLKQEITDMSKEKSKMEAKISELR